MNTTNRSRHFAVVVLAAALGLGMSGGVAWAARQSAPTTDHSSSTGQAVSDAWITTKVKSELATTRGVKSMDVMVKTVDGVVTLTGVLPTRIAVNKAIAVAQSVKGVKDVDASGLKSQG
ncbi:MAG: BON domain-containing protein [Xanthomonadales bacterium]|nr:BON domain-containing protein [Xanthomonadales bacterium]ODU94527.1 MAG: transporter [Rhodanobacter sp. SCN 66-43]OJY87141.1 MAG: transporter [Xanthomonadales bacterium 66-474]